MRMAIRRVRIQTTDFGLQQYGEPIPIELELEEDERVLYIESGSMTGGFDEVAAVADFWIGRPL